MKFLFTLLLIAVATVCFAQKPDTTYFKNNDLVPVVRDSADYFRVVSQPDPAVKLYTVTEFYKSGKRKMEGKAVADVPLALEEEVTTYFENGNKQSVSRFKSRMKVGREYLFFPNGKPYINQAYTGKLHKSTIPEVLIVDPYLKAGQKPL